MRLLFDKISSIHYRFTRRYILKPGRRTISSLDISEQYRGIAYNANSFKNYSSSLEYTIVNQNFVLSNIEKF